MVTLSIPTTIELIKTSQDEAEALIDLEEKQAEQTPAEGEEPLKTSVQGSVSLGRVICNSINALIKSSRSANEQGLTPLAQRLMDYWGQDPELRVGVRAEGMSVNGALVRKMDPDEVSWLLPAYMAGLRDFQLKETCRTTDLLLFAEALATLKPTTESLSGFRDWIWAEGAEGLSVELRQSFTDVMESLTVEPGVILNADQNIAEMPRRNASPMMLRSGEELGKITGQYSGKLRTHIDRANREERLSLPMKAQLLTMIEDGAWWSNAEIEVSFAIPSIRKATMPIRIAQRLMSWADARVDPILIGRISAIMTSTDDHSLEIVQLLEDHKLGGMLAKRVNLRQKANRRALRQFIWDATPKTRLDLISGLVEKTLESPEIADWVSACIGMHADRVDLEEIPKIKALGAKNVAKLMELSKGDEKALSDLLSTLDPTFMVKTMEHLSDEAFWVCSPQTKAILSGDHKGAVTAMLDHLSTRKGLRPVRMLTEQLEKTGGEKWNPRRLGEICRQIAAHNAGRQQLLSWAKSRQAPLPLRLSAIRSMTPYPEMVKEITRRSVGQLFEPPAIKKALKELRNASATSTQESE